MKIEAMLHTLKAASAVCQATQFLVIGSQAILGHCKHKDVGFAFDESMEIDIVPVPDNQALSDLIDGTIGEESAFHNSFGYYAHGVGIKTAVFPDGWEQRLIALDLDMGDSVLKVYFPSVEDLVLSKYVAGREKDRSFIERVASEDLADPAVMANLVQKLPSNLHESARKKIEVLVKKDFCRHHETGLSPS